MFFWTLCFLLTSQACSTEFSAAVVEYYPIQERNLKPEVRLLENSKAYISFLNKLEQPLDIVVFPESTLHVNAIIRRRSDVVDYAVKIQDEPNDVSLCTDDNNNQAQSAFLTTLACAAVNHKTYLVVNLLEKAECNRETQRELGGCSEDGWNLYNTNVVFNRKGAFVSKYRKYNLFGEYFLNQTANPDVAVFKTDFDVKFGMFTCFDLMFRKPTVDLVKEHGVNHLIFPTMWFSELPFLTALQAQQQWVHELDTVFLAAGANDPRVGSGGSGIFQGKSGPLVFDIIGKSGSKAYRANISKYPQVTRSEAKTTTNTDELAKEMDGFYLKKDDLTLYTSKLLTAKQENVNEVLCSSDKGNNKLCCRFDITLEWNNEIFEDGKSHYRYRMVAYSGVRSFSGVYNGGVEICGVVACVDEGPDSCTYRFKNYDEVSWPVTFKKISVKANFTLEDNKIQYPNSLLSSIRPLPVDAVTWSRKYFADNTVIERTYNLEKPQNRLMTFAIYGRDFNRDGVPELKKEW